MAYVDDINQLFHQTELYILGAWRPTIATLIKIKWIYSDEFFVYSYLRKDP